MTKYYMFMMQHREIILQPYELFYWFFYPCWHDVQRGSKYYFVFVVLVLLLLRTPAMLSAYCSIASPAELQAFLRPFTLHTFTGRRRAVYCKFSPAAIKAENFPKLREAFKNCSSELFFGRLKGNVDFFCHFLLLYDHNTTNC
jgi:hypothetical protein